MSERVINKVTSTSTNLPPVLLDLTGDTVNEKNLERNQTAHNSGGQKITGALAIEEAEAWARGTKNGTPVPPTDETYQNNSRYYSIVSGSIMRMAGQQAIAAATSATNAANSATAAAASENNAKASETAAANSAVISGSCMNIAGVHAGDAEAWAIGKRNGQLVPPVDPAYNNNSKYYKELCESIASSLVSVLKPKGTCLFADLPAIADSIVGDLWNIEDEFTTTADFREGAGKLVNAGANVYLTIDNKWDIMAGVTSDYIGATANADGVHGLVNPAQAGQQNYYYKGNGTWDRSEIDDIENVYGAKNLIPFPYAATLVNGQVTRNGITYTVYDDGRVKMDTGEGSASAATSFVLVSSNIDYAVLLPRGSYTLSGMPSTSKTSIKLTLYNNGTAITTYSVSGEPVTFTVDQDNLYAGIQIYSSSGAVLNNVIASPMLRFASIADDTYVPYAKTNLELTKSKVEQTQYNTEIPALQTATTVTEITDSAPYLYRASAGGDRQYDKLIGGSVVWNQTAPAMSTDNWEVNNSRNVSVSSSDGIITATIINPPSSSSAYRQGIMVKSANRTPLLANHKYLISYTVNPSVDCSFIDQTTSNGSHEIACSANSWNINTFVDQSAQDKSGALLVYPTSILEVNTTYQVKNFVVHDLTAMFGTTIADYVNAREIAEAGSGIAWLKSYGFFGKDYYAYDVGSLLSVNTSGHKLTGTNILATPYYDGTSKLHNGVQFTVNEDGSILVNRVSASSSDAVFYLRYFQNINGTVESNPYVNKTITINGVPEGSASSKFRIRFIHSNANDSTNVYSAGATCTVEDISGQALVQSLYIEIKSGYSPSNLLFKPMIRLASVADSTYQPYTDPITYPLTSTDLRGTLSLSGDELVYDGDVYESDGTETVKYALLSNQTGAIGDTITLTGYKTSGKIICDKGLISDIGTISGTTLTLTAAITSASFVYELATPTTATLSPFVSPQICDKDGTEEYIDTRAVPMPVGHYTEYYGVPEWLRDRYLDELRELPYKITPISNGGTGLSSSPSMLTNLGSTSAADVLQASPRPGVTGTLGFSNGGTGATSRLNAAKALTNENVPSPTYLIGMTNSWGKFGYVSPANAKTFLKIPISLLDYLGVAVPSGTSAIDFWRTIVPVENRTVFAVTPGTGAGGASSSSPWGATNTNRSSGVNNIGAYSCKLATLTTSSPYGRGQCEIASTEYRVHLMTGSASNYVLLAAYTVGNKIQNFKIYEMYNSSSNSYTVLMGMIF